MRLIDLHTHHKDRENNLFILNCTLENIEDARNISVGLHPWNIDEDWEQKMLQISATASMENVKAIGECGIDKLKSGASVCRELVMVKVAVTPETRQAIISVADIFRANIVDVCTDSLVIELTGNLDKVEAFIKLLEEYEILELARTGITGLSRGTADVRILD